MSTYRPPVDTTSTSSALSSHSRSRLCGGELVVHAVRGEQVVAARGIVVHVSLDDVWQAHRAVCVGLSLAALVCCTCFVAPCLTQQAVGLVHCEQLLPVRDADGDEVDECVAVLQAQLVVAHDDVQRMAGGAQHGHAVAFHQAAVADRQLTSVQCDASIALRGRACQQLQSVARSSLHGDGAEVRAGVRPAVVESLAIHNRATAAGEEHKAGVDGQRRLRQQAVHRPIHAVHLVHLTAQTHEQRVAHSGRGRERDDGGQLGESDALTQLRRESATGDGASDHFER